MIDVVVPTIGRPSLAKLLASIARAKGPRPAHILLVDDRANRSRALDLGDMDDDLRARLTVVNGTASGPAAARNAGWRHSRARWIAFVDDDVVVDDDWLAALAGDLSDLPLDVAGSQGFVRVPLPAGRPPTDWERNVAALENARWITADCAYRRAELLAIGGFDERFPRAYREDADLALRIVARGKRIVSGTRTVAHPVRPAPWWISVRLQAGNADDVLMTAIHGRTWRERASAPQGTFPLHVATVSSAALAIAAGVARRPRTATVACAAWFLLWLSFAWRRIAPGPRTPAEIAGVAATSIAIPAAAVFHRIRGVMQRPRMLRDRKRAPHPIATAVLFDRDGTLIVDIPFNADPARVTPMPGARTALDRLREAGIPTAVISNQAGVALGALRHEDVDAINARTEALLGPLGPVFLCLHSAEDNCACRKPAPGLIRAAARELGVDPRDCVVIGDIGADVEAAHSAGARAVLVATALTRPEEIAAAPNRARDLGEAVGAVLSGSV